jgi:hypothetical protein
MKFTATQVDVNGMSLAHYVDDISMNDILNHFPEGRMKGYYDYEKGYDNDEVGFEDEVGNQYYVYSRYGHVRIGNRDGFDSASCKELEGFIKNALKSSGI